MPIMPVMRWRLAFQPYSQASKGNHMFQRHLFVLLFLILIPVFTGATFAPIQI